VQRPEGAAGYPEVTSTPARTAAVARELGSRLSARSYERPPWPPTAPLPAGVYLVHYRAAPAGGPLHKESLTMLKYALIFAIVSLIAGALGFTGVAAGAAGIAKVLFFVFVALAVLFVVLGLLGVGAARKALR